MTTSTIVWIVVVAVAALLLIGGLVWLARSKRHQHRHMEPGNIRKAAEEETLHVRQHEALADGTAAKARAAQTEADVWAAQASGLQQQAAARRGEAATWRDQLDAQWARANELDPDSQTPDGPKSTEPQHQ